MNPWEKGILYITIGLTVALLGKLWFTGLVKVYKLFFCFLATDLFATIASLTIPYHSSLYAYSYIAAQTLKIIIAAFMLSEIYSLALERQPALARFGRSAVGYILALAGAIPVIWILADHSAQATNPYLRAFFSFEQAMNATMALFLILISLFLAWFPVRMRRNVIIYSSGFIVWALSRSVLDYLINRWFTNKELNLIVNITQTCIGLGCLWFWFFGLQREGENRTAVVGHLWNRAEAERLTEQLDAINNSLERLRQR